MSGLAVLFRRDRRPVQRETVWAMLNAVPYRGPDGMRVQVQADLGLGFAKMATTPEEEDEQQPLISPRTGCVVIADARLDNRASLLARLPERISPTASDAELILCAYEAWGTDAVEKLLGDFAFVIWDPVRQRLTCARDTSGQRPLFYRLDHRVFAASSEIHQLLQDPSVPMEPNEEHIRGALVPRNMFRNTHDQSTTFYTGIYSLPAGQLLIVDRATDRLHKYWEFQFGSELHYRNADEYAEHYSQIFSEAVRARLRTSRPVGALLSGGLDSSSVVCMAEDLIQRGSVGDPGFISFTSVFEGLECNERDLVQDIQNKYHFKAEYIPSEQAIGVSTLAPRGFLESPFIGGSDQLGALCDAVGHAGVRVLLTGDVADCCIAGSPLVFDSLLRHGKLRDVGRYLNIYRSVSNDSLRKIFTLYVLGPFLPLALQRRLMLAYTRRALRRTWHRQLPNWLGSDIREDLRWKQLDLSLAAERNRRFSSIARQWEYDLLYPPEIAPNPPGRSIVTWRPFADRRVHEFLLRIPPEQKFSPASGADQWYAASKQLTRRAMRGLLPDSIRTRTTKPHFGSAYLDGIQRQLPAYEAAFGPSARLEIADRGYVDPDLFRARLAALGDGAMGNDFMYILSMVSLERWLRGFRLSRPHLVTVVGAQNQPGGSELVRDVAVLNGAT